jgi:hypothetical protein
MKNRIRVVAEKADDYLRCERCLDAAKIPFDLNHQHTTPNSFVIFVDNEFLQLTLNLLARERFTAANET